MPYARRKFLAAAAAASAASCSRSGSRWRFFTLPEAACVEALCDLIVPQDQEPGARWARVPEFIDRQLMGFHRGFQRVYREGVGSLDAACRKHYGKPFAQLEPARRQAAVKAIGTTPFFTAVVTHTMQGFYGNPRHGGNREAVSWRMLGLPEPPVRGRLRYDLTRKG